MAVQYLKYAGPLRGIIYKYLKRKRSGPASQLLLDACLDIELEGACHQEREGDGGVPDHLDALGVMLHLAPADSLFDVGSGVRPFVLVRCREVDGVVRPVAEEVGVGDVVLGH